MSLHDAEPGDVYADADGKLWRVVGICGEPTVIVREIESATPDNPVLQRGGVSGLMWEGFKRIHRPVKPRTTVDQYRANAGGSGGGFTDR